MDKFYKIISKEMAEEYQVYPCHVTMKCYVCGNKWGISLDPGRAIVARDLVCQVCATEKYLSNK